MAKILKGDEYKKKMNLQDRVDADLSSSVAAMPGMGGVINREMLGVGEQARQIFDEARQDATRVQTEAQELLAQVQEEMDRSKKAGFEQGYQEGLQAALELLVRVKELRAKLFADNEREMIKLIFAIAEKIIGREFSENDKAIMNVIRLAVSDAVGEKIYIRINPSDYENIKKNEAELQQAVEAGKSLIFREDETVKAGGCTVETDIGTIDAQLETQLSAIKKALGL